MINTLDNLLQKNNKKLFIKIHASVNQKDDKGDNFNFIPQYCNKTVGIHCHSLMFYGLTDNETPIYGRKNFNDMSDFMIKQKNIRSTYYFPETSYWVGLDIDIPLFLTDYMRTRFEDMSFCHKNNIDNIITFTSGQEIGYWLYDWSVCLYNWSDDQMIGLKLLGENINTWENIFKFQKKYFKEKNVISMITATNLMDELSKPFQNKILNDRYSLIELHNNKLLTIDQIAILDETVSFLPSIIDIESDELKTLLIITHNRIKHTFNIRLAIYYNNKKDYLEQAANIRMESLDIINQFIHKYNNYPKSNIYNIYDNPTSYNYGYIWSVKTLHFWNKEELMVKYSRYDPLFMNIYNPFMILL
jgi:hypothetical protein